MPVPIRTRSVHAAAAVSSSSGDHVVLYASGTGMPGRAAYGADGSSAKNKCSCTHRLENPSASARSQNDRTAWRVTCAPSCGSVSPTPKLSNIDALRQGVDRDGAEAAVHGDRRPVGDPLGGICDRGNARDAELTAD